MCLLLILCLFLSTACQQSASGPVGGTPGTLKMGEVPLADFQIKVFRAADGELLGTGATNWEGKFQLVSAESPTAYTLVPGEYVCTLESFGTDAPKLAAAYNDKSKSPLKLKWTGDEQQMELVIPAK